MPELEQQFIDLMKAHQEYTKEFDYYEGMYSTPVGVRIVEQQGDESKGRYAHTVWEWNGDYFRLDFNYYSYDGYDLDNIRHVQKVDRIVSFYE